MRNDMKALVKAKPEPGLWLRDEPVPEIGPDEVLVKIAKTGICGTDIHIWNWDDWAQKTIPVPMITGHEYAGKIVEIGAGVRGLKVGQRVSGEGHVIGMRSRASRGGRYHLDPETQGIGVNIPGAFAEYVKIPAFNAVPLPDDIDDELGAILDPLGNAVHTALSFDLVGDRKSTRLNSSHGYISYAVFCLKKKKTKQPGVALTLVDRANIHDPHVDPLVVNSPNVETLLTFYLSTAQSQ